MAIHITASGATTVSSAGPRGILITVNTALTGTITTTDQTGVIAVVTNPVAGNAFRYYGLLGATTVNPSATTDITVSILNSKE